LEKEKCGVFSTPKTDRIVSAWILRKVEKINIEHSIVEPFLVAGIDAVDLGNGYKLNVE
jgi:hypothetical protein